MKEQHSGAVGKIWAYLRSIFTMHPGASLAMAVLVISMTLWIGNLLVTFIKDPFQFSQTQQIREVQRSSSYAYLFSSLAQSLAAILGLLGVFVVYRLEQLRSQIKGGGFPGDKLTSEEAKPYENKREDIKNCGFALAILIMLAIVLSLLLIGRCEYLCVNPYLGSPYFAVTWGIPVVVVVMTMCLAILSLVAWFAYLALSGKD